MIELINVHRFDCLVSVYWLAPIDVLEAFVERMVSQTRRESCAEKMYRSHVLNRAIPPDKGRARATSCSELESSRESMACFEISVSKYDRAGDRRHHEVGVVMR